MDIVHVFKEFIHTLTHSLNIHTHFLQGTHHRLKQEQFGVGITPKGKILTFTEYLQCYNTLYRYYFIVEERELTAFTSFSNHTVSKWWQWLQSLSSFLSNSLAPPTSSPHHQITIHNTFLGSRKLMFLKHKGTNISCHLAYTQHCICYKFPNFIIL